MTTKHQIYAGKKTGIACADCGQGEQIIQQNRGTGEFFLSCTRWPECEFSSNLPEDIRLRALGQKGLFDT